MTGIRMVGEASKLEEKGSQAGWEMEKLWVLRKSTQFRRVGTWAVKRKGRGWWWAEVWRSKMSGAGDTDDKSLEREGTQKHRILDGGQSVK